MSTLTLFSRRSSLVSATATGLSYSWHAWSTRSQPNATVGGPLLPAFSTSARHLTVSGTTVSSTRWSILESDARLWPGLRPTGNAAGNVFWLMAPCPRGNLFLPEYPKAQSLVHYCFCFTPLIFRILVRSQKSAAANLLTTRH